MKKTAVAAAVIALILNSNMTRSGMPGAFDLARFAADRPAQTRSMDVAHVDRENRTVELSFSSELPVQRWFGNEILDHSPEAVDLTRLGSGRAALLMDHDWNAQIGVIESVRIDPDRIGRAVVRFSRSQRAEEIFNDVADGIRSLVSVGYKPLEAKLITERDDGPDDYLITRWMPYEISFVSVPADHTVGVGRAAPFNAIPHNDNPDPTGNNGKPEHKPAAPTSKTGARDMKVKYVKDDKGNHVRALVDENDQIVEVLEIIKRADGGTPASTVDADEAVKAERKRISDLTSMGELYGVQAAAARAVADGTTPESFAAIALEEVNKRGAKQPGTKNPLDKQGRSHVPLGEMERPEIGLDNKEVRRYSMFKAIRFLQDQGNDRLREEAAFEIECSQAAEKQTGRSAQGLLIPQDVLNNFGNDATMRAFNANQGAANTPVGAITGGNLVQTNFLASSFIEMLRNRTPIMGLARVMGGLVGNVEIPKQIGASQAYWIGEHEDAQETTPVIGQIGFKPHTLAAYTDITRRLMMQSTPDAEGIVRADLLDAIAQGINTAAFYGDGSGNAPTGLLYQDGINAMALQNEFMTYAEAVDMESEIAADNADVASMAYVMNARARGAAKKQPKFADGASVADAGVLWETGGTINGYRTEISNSIKQGDYFFGNWKDFVIAMWGGLDMIVDPYSLSKKGALRIVVFQDVDFGLRRTESFVYAKKASA